MQITFVCSVKEMMGKGKAPFLNEGLKEERGL